MHVYRAGLAAVIVIPDLRENLIARKHHTAVFQQIAQQFKFFVREDHGFTINRNGAALHIHRKRARRKKLILRCGLCGPAQQRTHTGDKLHHAERLRHVIVRAAVQPNHTVIFAAFRRQHHHGQVGRFRTRAQTLQNMQTVFIRQHNVEQHELRQLFFKRLPEIGRIPEALGFKTGGVQCIEYKLADAVVVLHKIDHKPLNPFCAALPLNRARR